jgi:hypothetical protein
MTSWGTRKQIGDALETHVRNELHSRGWAANRWGQGILDERIRRVLRHSESAARWTPDLIAGRGESICFIDCKASMTSRTSRRHAVERAAVRAHLQLVAWTHLPVYYVFDNLGVATPYDALIAGTDGPDQCAGSGTPYFLIAAANDRSFDSVFGGFVPPTSMAA